MNSTSHLRLDRLNLKNFRCFDRSDLDFHEKLTVLVAENGQGKTAVLDAIAIALGLFVDTVAATRHHGFYRTDVRLTRAQDGTMIANLPTAFDAQGQVAGQPVKWSRELRKYSLRARSSTKDAEHLRKAAQGFRDNSGNSAILPLVAFYGTGRLWSEHRLTEGKRENALSGTGRFSAYTDCLTSFSSFKGFLAWYEQKVNEIADPKFKGELSHSLPLVSAVNEAVRIVLEPVGWRELGWDSAQKALIVNHPVHGKLPLSLLSDGVRNMIALIADIAYRCATLNPYFSEKAAQQTPGILLIDEVDMHLHPRWQQMIVELLRKAFPSLQMVITTHSPHVLSTVDRQSIRVLRIVDGKIVSETPTLQTRGVMSADVLAAIMRVDPVPPIEEAAWLSQYRAMIEDGAAERDEALALRRKLNSHFGESHPLMDDCDRLIRFQAFRLKKKAPEES
jgi:predicted ATP-binding protein involved in virulence